MPRNPETTPTYYLTRRNFVKAALFTPMALAQLACDLPSHQDIIPASADQKLFDSFTMNEQLVEEFRKRLRITSDTDRQAYAQRVTQLAKDQPNWMQGVRVTYTNDRGEKVGYTIDDTGEGRPNFPPKYKSTYPIPNPILSETVSLENNRHLVVYGTSETVARFKERKDDFPPFVQEYFEGIGPAVLHLLFSPSANNLDLRNPLSTQNIKAQNTMGRSATVMSAGKITETHIILHVPLIHAVAANFGIKSESKLTGTLVNEMTDVFIAHNLLPQDPKFKARENIGTIATNLAQLDETFAQLVLGGESYKKFNSAVTDEIGQIGSIKAI